MLGNYPPIDSLEAVQEFAAITQIRSRAMIGLSHSNQRSIRAMNSFWADGSRNPAGNSFVVSTLCDTSHPLIPQRPADASAIFNKSDCCDRKYIQFMRFTLPQPHHAPMGAQVASRWPCRFPQPQCHSPAHRRFPARIGAACRRSPDLGTATDRTPPHRPYGLT